MASEWRQIRLGEVCAVNPDKRGRSHPHDPIRYVDISTVGTGLLESEPDLVPLASAPSRAQRLVRDGDTIVATVRPNRRAFLYLRDPSPDTVVSTGFAVLRAGASLDPRFLYYIVSSQPFTDWLVSRAKGSAYPAVTAGDFEDALVSIPPIPEQRAIAHILGTLDDKIELNRRMARTLEEMARALFKAWFVDFEPVRAKMDGRWRRGESLPGLPSHLYDLFPDRLVDSALGPIPEGWEVKSLDDLAKFLNGLALQKYPPSGDGRFLPVIKIAQLRSGTTRGADKASADLDPAYVVQDGDVLFSWSGSLECVYWTGGPGALNQHLFKVTPLGYPKWLCYLAIHAHLPEFRHIAAGKATTMGHIQRHHLSDAKQLIATSPIVQAADAVLGPMTEAMWRYAVESRNVAALRDTLLPRLVSGSLRVPDAERILADAS